MAFDTKIETKPAPIKAENGYSLQLYNPKFNAGLAQMWNESDEQWPGTFTRGVPFTEERVEEWMERVTAIVKYIAVAPDGKVVGYGDLWEELDRPSSAYVALLNVHPEHQGKSLARRMLTEMVDWATANGYDRVTIGTWPANLKAMPLYKKVGFFWEPNTGVHMANYVPAVRQLSLAQDFFARHDWYQTYDRELKQVEDEMRHPMTGDMKIFTLRWSAKGETLEAVFDRNSQALTGLATDKFAAYTQVETSEPAQGLTYPVRWQLFNKNNKPTRITLMAFGTRGVEINYRTTFTLAPGEQQTISADFHCAIDAPPYEADSYEKPTPQIKTLIIVDGEVMEFGTGLRFRPALETSLYPETASLVPGQPATVQISLHNRAQQAFDAVVAIDPIDGVEMDWQNHKITISPDGMEALPLTITAQKPGLVNLTTRVHLPVGDETIATAPKELPIIVAAPGSAASGLGDDMVLVENDHFRLTCKAKSGETKFWDKMHRWNTLGISEELGPPFVPWDLHTKKYALELTQENGAIKVLMTAESGRFAGLVLQREITLTAGPLVKLRYRVSNQGQAAQTCQLNPNFTNFLSETNDVVVPLAARIVRGHSGEFWPAEGDIPKKPEQFAEPWIAFELGTQVAGVIWPAPVDEHLVGWNRFGLQSLPLTLEPQTGEWTEPIYLYVGPGSWHQIQATWQRLAARQPENAPLSTPAQPGRYFELQVGAMPLVTLKNQVETQLQVTNLREYQLNGELILEAPAGWTADRTSFPVEGLNKTNPLETPLVFTSSAAPTGVYQGTLHFKNQLFDHTQPYTLFRLGDAAHTVSVTQEQQHGQQVWRMDNGRSAWTVAPGFHGGVVSWQENGQGIEHLHTSFPDDGKLAWMKPWFGGLRPIIHNPRGQGGWPGKLHTESFEVTPTAHGDAPGLPWRGVTLTTDLTMEVFRGLTAELAYLTLPGSNVLKFVCRLINQTGVTRYVEPALLAFLQVDGRYDNARLHGDGFHRKRTPQMAWVTKDRWVAIENPDTGRAITVVNARGWRQVHSTDWGVDGGHVLNYESTIVPPHGEYEMVVYLILAPSVAAGQQYQALGDL